MWYLRYSVCLFGPLSLKLRWMFSSFWSKGHEYLITFAISDQYPVTSSTLPVITHGLSKTPVHVRLHVLKSSNSVFKPQWKVFYVSIQFWLYASKWCFFIKLYDHVSVSASRAYVMKSKYTWWKAWENEHNVGYWWEWWVWLFKVWDYDTGFSMSDQLSVITSDAEGQRKKINQGKKCWYSWCPLLLQSLSLQSFAALGLPQHDFYLFSKPQKTTLPQIYSVFQQVYIFHIHATWSQGGPQLDPVPHGAAPLLYFIFTPINFAANCLPALEESGSSQTPAPLTLIQTLFTSLLAYLLQTEEF